MSNSILLVKSKFLHWLFPGITKLAHHARWENWNGVLSSASFGGAHRIDFSMCRWNYTMSIVVASIHKASIVSVRDLSNERRSIGSESETDRDERWTGQWPRAWCYATERTPADSRCRAINFVMPRRLLDIPLNSIKAWPEALENWAGLPSRSNEIIFHGGCFNSFWRTRFFCLLIITQYESEGRKKIVWSPQHGSIKENIATVFCALFLMRTYWESDAKSKSPPTNNLGCVHSIIFPVCVFCVIRYKRRYY